MTDVTTSPPTDLDPVGLEPIGHCRVLRRVVDQPGIETVEGRFVPLLGGETIRSHAIVMHAGQWCHPHPHPTESIIYTVRGRWVFCTTDDGTEDGEEVRTVIEAGDLFHFVADVPTGFETPLGEDAVILILKSGGADREEMAEGMRAAKESLDAQAADGEPFTMRELPDDHPSHVFAREFLAAESS